jgi:hypothetical protein
VLVALVFLLLLPSVARPQESSPPQSFAGVDEYTISVSSECVVLHATVQNHKGMLVSGLHKE